MNFCTAPFSRDGSISLISVNTDTPEYKRRLVKSCSKGRFSRVLVWADCEALERRHKLGRGTLIVLDVVPESGTPNYEQGRTLLESMLPTDSVFSGDTKRPVPCSAVMLTPALRVDSHAEALAFYQRLRAANRAHDCDFFEGIVVKRAESSYPVQLRSPTESFAAG